MRRSGIRSMIGCVLLACVMAIPALGVGPGAVNLETWNQNVSDLAGAITFLQTAGTPATTGLLTPYSMPESYWQPGRNFYVSRTQGWIIPPLTGTYTIYVTSDDDSGLWLNSDEKTNFAVDPICRVTGWASQLVWLSYASQKSAPVDLVAGKAYAVRTIHRENDGGDHIAMGWTLPGEPATKITVVGQQYMRYNLYASSPEPANNATGVLDGALSCYGPLTLTGSTAKLYFSPDPNFLGVTPITLTPGANEILTHNPGKPGSGLAFSTQYYWRVDVLDPNTGGTPVLRTGTRWSFTTIHDRPYFTTAPQSTNVSAGKNAQFTAVAATLGAPGITYQWFKRVGAATEEASSPAANGTLNFAPATLANKGTYFCRVTNANGSTDSADVTLFVRQGLAHRYGFDGNANDSVGTAHGVVKQGTGSQAGSITFAGGKMTMNNPAWSDNPGITYVDLPNGMISALGTQMTIAIWVNATINDWWQRIIDFGTSGPGENLSGGSDQSHVDYIFLTPRGFNGNLGSEYKSKTNGNRVLQWSKPMDTGVETFIVLTWSEDANEFKMYVNGALITQSDTQTKLAQMTDNNNWIGRSQWADRGFNGVYDELRIYDEALSAGWVTAMKVAGPDVVPTNACIAKPQSDINDDCRADLADLAILAGEWLKCGLIDCGK